MDRPTKRSKLLVLKGVYIKDFITLDNIYDKNKPIVKTEPVIAYTEMPKKFTAVEEWPKFSNLKCWCCDQLPTTYPKFIPLNPAVALQTDTCDVYGHFCEWNCAVRFVLSDFPSTQHWDLLESIKLFESKFSGKRKVVIAASPPKTLLKAYCGAKGITVKQWHAKLNELNTDHNLTHYKLEHYREQYP